MAKKTDEFSKELVYQPLSGLSQDLQTFYRLTSAQGQGLNLDNFKQVLYLIRDLSIQDLKTLKLSDLTQQRKPSSENQFIRMLIDQRIYDEKIDLSKEPRIFVYNKENTLWADKDPVKVYTIRCDTTIRAREEFRIEPFVGKYKDTIDCEATHMLFTDRVGFPPIVSSLRIRYKENDQEMNKVISERSFSTTRDQWECFLAEAARLSNEVYGLEETCYRPYLYEAVTGIAKKTVEETDNQTKKPTKVKKAQLHVQEILNETLVARKPRKV